MKKLYVMLFFILMTACVKETATIGYIYNKEKVAQIKVGSTNHSSVREIMGSPTSVSAFGDEIWYYISADSKKRAVFNQKIDKQQIVSIAFDKNGTVSSVKDDSSIPTKIAIDKTKTGSAGKKLTVWEQVIGNVGRFNEVPQ
jgi:outer membrane protein assembly factor BamE (lipoprotein component of BamABCDE complex)